jgi:hypothetical protein
MIEVFKTDIRNPIQGNLVIDLIHQTFPDFRASFDLEDCDKILRIESPGPNFPTQFLMELLENFGFLVEILPDEPSVAERTLIHENSGVFG